jgi:hypothetical protein
MAHQVGPDHCTSSPKRGSTIHDEEDIMGTPSVQHGHNGGCGYRESPRSPNDPNSIGACVASRKLQASDQVDCSDRIVDSRFEYQPCKCPRWWDPGRRWYV